MRNLVETSASSTLTDQELFFLGLKHVDEGNHELAVHAFKSSLEIEPASETAYYLGVSLMKLERYCEAQAAFEMVDQESRAGERAEYLGEAYRLTSRMTSAARAYRAALQTDRKRHHVVHCGLTKLLRAGIDVGFGKYYLPILDEEITAGRSGQKVIAQLRVFRDQTEADRTVAMFVTEATPRGDKGMGVMLGAELLLELVTTRKENRLDAASTTFITMFERAAHGQPPMEIRRIRFDAAPKQRFYWPASLGGSGPAPRFQNVEFFPLSHRELERMIRFRFFWEA